MNLTDLEQRVLLALLEHGTGHLNSLPSEQLRELLGCSHRELIKARVTLFGLGLASGSQTSDYLTPEGMQVARDLQAAPERERAEKAEVSRQFWLTRGEKFLWVVIGTGIGSVGTLVVLWLANKWNLSP